MTKTHQHSLSMKSLTATGIAVVLACLVVTTSRSMSFTRQIGRQTSLALEAQPVATRSAGPSFSYTGYKPAPVESYIVNHTQQLGLDKAVPARVQTCHIWNDATVTPYHAQLHQFLKEMDAYYALVNSFQLGIKDLRKNITDTNHDVCELVKLHPDGLPGLFNTSKQLSFTSSGWVEPMLPPMRHPKFCVEGRQYRQHLMRMDYMVHDFHALCLKLKPTSRTVFIDMGASLSFRGQKSPVLFLLNMFTRFGIHFDHIYAYEYTQQDPNTVFKQIPEDFQAAYHWINVGVEAGPANPRNPLKMLMDNFNADDLIIVKLDVDKPQLERALAQEILGNKNLWALIDHFYFEHHVNQRELAGHWGPTQESVADSMNLFFGLRQKGIPAHFWV